MENQKSFKKFIENSENILILLSKNPYLDQVAAGLSLYLALKESGKKVSVACPSPMVVEYNRLVGVNKIATEIGDKNLVIRFKNYKAQNIERVTYDIDNETQEFRLSVIPKPDVAAPSENQLNIKYSGISADTVILVGGANEGHFPDLESDVISNAKIAHIGKQDVASSAKRTITSFSEHKASVSELMAIYIKEINSKFDQDIASNLLAGIKEGTRDFSHTAVDADTFQLASELMRAGGDASADYNQGNRDSEKKQTKEPILVSASEAKKIKVETTSNGLGEDESQNEIAEDDAPSSWLEPKIFKGTNSK